MDISKGLVSRDSKINSSRKGLTALSSYKSYSFYIKTYKYKGCMLCYPYNSRIEILFYQGQNAF